MRNTPFAALSLLLCLPLLSCQTEGRGGGGSEGEGEGEGSEGEGEGADQDATADADLDARTDAAVDADAGGGVDVRPDAGDLWENEAKLKDGITPRRRPPKNPKLTVVFTRPVLAGGGRQLYAFRGTGPDDGEVVQVRLRSFGTPSNPFVSSDGDFVTFFEAGGAAIGISDMRADETSVAVRAGAGQQARNPVLSARAQILAYQLDVGTARQIMLYELDLDKTTPVWEVPGNTGFPEISDNGDLVFFHTDASGDHEVVRWSEQRGPVNISNEPDKQDLYPDASLDGETVCWRRAGQAADLVGHSVVWGNNVTRNVTQEYRDSLGGLLNFWDCQVVSTGRYVVFRAHTNNGHHEWMKAPEGAFYRYDLNADEHRRLPEPTGVIRDNPDKPYGPWRLSTDGRTIVFAGYAEGADSPDIFALDLSGGETYNLTNSPEGEGLGAPGVN